MRALPLILSMVKYSLRAVAGVLVLGTAIFLVSAGGRPKIVEGTDRPAWLPAAATDVRHSSRESFGWFKKAEFTINEIDLRAYARAQGWELTEKTEYDFFYRSLFTPTDREFTEEDVKPMPRALVCDKRSANGGGTTLVYNVIKGRAYLFQSHR